MKENSYKIVQYLQEHNGATAKEVSTALGIDKRFVDSYFSAAVVKTGLGARDTSVTPSRLVLNDEGLSYTQ
jgi:predicted transcriptional regulator